MSKIKYKTVSNQAELVEELSKFVYPQLLSIFVGNMKDFIEHELFVDSNLKVKKPGEIAYKLAVDLQNGVSPEKIAEKLSGTTNKSSDKDIEDTAAALAIVGYFIKGGPEIYFNYVKYNKEESIRVKTVERLKRQELQHKVYDAELKVEQVKKEIIEKRIARENEKTR